MKTNMLCVLVAGLFVSGCGTSNVFKMGSGAKKEDMPNQEAPAAMKEDLTSSLMVVDRKAQMSKDGQINVTAKILNKSSNAVPVQITTVFKDAQGQVIDQTSPSKAEVPANAYHYYFGSTSNREARTFEIVMKAV